MVSFSSSIPPITILSFSVRFCNKINARVCFACVLKSYIVAFNQINPLFCTIKLYQKISSSSTTCSTNCSCSCYFVRSCIYNRICVVGKKETIYPLVQTVNALYLQLLEMQKVFTAPDFTPDNLTTLVKMWLGYFLTKNISDFYLMAFPV